MDTSFQHVLIWHLAIIFGHPHCEWMIFVHVFTWLCSAKWEWYCPIFFPVPSSWVTKIWRNHSDRKSSHSWCQTWQGRSKSGSKKVGHLGELGDSWLMESCGILWARKFGTKPWCCWMFANAHKSIWPQKLPRRQQFPSYSSIIP